MTEDFFDVIARVAAKVLLLIGIKLEYAQVVAFSDGGEPLLRFTGETAVSPKIYSRMRHYVDPTIGDRVLVLNNIILGSWTTTSERN